MVGVEVVIGVVVEDVVDVLVSWSWQMSMCGNALQYSKKLL